MSRIFTKRFWLTLVSQRHLACRRLSKRTRSVSTLPFLLGAGKLEVPGVWLKLVNSCTQIVQQEPTFQIP